MRYSLSTSDLIKFIIKAMKYEYLHSDLNKFDLIGNIFKNVLPSSYYDSAAKSVYDEYANIKSNIDIVGIYEQIDINLDLINRDFIINLLDLINHSLKFYKKLRKTILVTDKANENIKQIITTLDALEIHLIEISNIQLENDDIAKFKTILTKFVEILEKHTVDPDFIDKLTIKIIKTLIIDNENYVATLRPIIEKEKQYFMKSKTSKNGLLNAQFAVSKSARDKV